MESMSGSFGKENIFKLDAITVIGNARVKMLVTRLAGAKLKALYQVNT